MRAFQKPFREYPGVEYRLGEHPAAGGLAEQAEWTFARLMYPPVPAATAATAASAAAMAAPMDSRAYSIWTQDYPRADRHFSAAVRRLTRIDVALAWSSR